MRNILENKNTTKPIYFNGTSYTVSIDDLTQIKIGGVKTSSVFLKEIDTNVYWNGTKKEWHLLRDDEIEDRYVVEERCDIFPEVKLEDQNKNVTIFPFDYSSKNLHFNPAIFTFNEIEYMCVRHGNFVLKDTQISTLKLYNLATNEEVKLNIKDEEVDEQYEDPRVFVYDNKLYISCVNYVHGNHENIHQKILVFDDKFNHIDNIHPIYGKNKKSIALNSGQEKNWTFFVYEDKLMCIYTMKPHAVIEFDWSGKLVSEYITHFDTKTAWKYGECRGGSNPILIGNYYHCFFHSSVPWKREYRRYIIGHYKFENKPPFKIVEMSKIPILWGNEKDEKTMVEMNHIDVFPCGAIFKNNEFTVSFGINEEKTGLIKIPYENDSIKNEVVWTEV